MVYKEIKTELQEPFGEYGLQFLGFAGLTPGGPGVFALQWSRRKLLTKQFPLQAKVGETIRVGGPSVIFLSYHRGAFRPRVRFGVAYQSALVACPTQKGSPALQGCPNCDGDGVADNKDRCPDQADPASNGGCPVRKAEEIEKINLDAKAIQYKTGSAVIQSKSYPVLDER